MLRIWSTARAGLSALIDIDHSGHQPPSRRIDGDKLLVPCEYCQLTPQDVSISRVGGGRFAMLFAAGRGAGEGLCRDIVSSGGAALRGLAKRFSITASVGMRGRGRCRPEISPPNPRYACRAKGGKTEPARGWHGGKGLAGRG